MIERLRQFEVNVKCEQEELYNLRQEYEQKLQEQQQQQESGVIKKIKQEYLSSVQKVQEESERKIQAANNHVNEMQKTLVRAEKKLSWLQNNLQELEIAKIALEQHDQAISLQQERLRTGGGDEGNRETGGILAGVMNSVEKAIRETEGKDRKTKDKIINEKLRGLKIQSNHIKKLSENSRGYKKREYEAFEKMTEIQANRMRVIFDIKPEEQNSMETVKEETRNNYAVKFEKFKK